MDFEPKLTVRFDVTAYITDGYGDDRSRSFAIGKDAVDYAQSLPPKFGATVTKIITMEPIRELYWLANT